MVMARPARTKHAAIPARWLRFVRVVTSGSPKGTTVRRRLFVSSSQET
jgi:hypothetical protein